jgi:rod shape-determining protein MreC
MAEFLRRNRVLLTSYGLLVLSILLISVSVRSPRREDPVALAVLDALAPLQGGVTLARTSVNHMWERYVWLVQASRENRRLQDRVAELEQQATRFEELRQGNERLEALLQFRAELQGEVYGARVVGRDPLLGSRTITLDRGQRDGIRKGMAVLARQGVVGQVIEVSHMAARALVLTDHNSGIDAMVQRTRARGIVQGDTEHGCRMKYLRRGEDVTVGDRVVTSGMDGIFPKGILIGEVKEVSRGQRGLLQMATVEPSVPLDSIEEVLIVGTVVTTENAG